MPKLMRSAPRYKKGDTIGHLEILETPGRDCFVDRPSGREYVYPVMCTRTKDVFTMTQSALRKRERGDVGDTCRFCQYIFTKKRMAAEIKEAELRGGITPASVASMKWRLSP